MDKPNTAPIDFQTDPSRYRHWRLRYEGPVAHLIMDVDPAGGLFPGYDLKLNSYDLGVDIELHDAVQRLRFEHPEVRSVVLRSGKDNVFCAGANIRMLGSASHVHKVNFCKFTNETRLSIEDASENSGQIYIAAVSGACAGGGVDEAGSADGGKNIGAVERGLNFVHVVGHFAEPDDVGAQMAGPAAGGAGERGGGVFMVGADVAAAGAPDFTDLAVHVQEVF